MASGSVTESVKLIASDGATADLFGVSREVDLNIWTSMTTQNAPDFITLSFSNGYTNIWAVPEPATCALIALSLGVLLLRRRNGGNTAKR